MKTLITDAHTIPAVEVDYDALTFAIDLSFRQITFRRGGDDRLVVNPKSLLTTDDDAELRRHKADLLRIADYVEARDAAHAETERRAVLAQAQPTALPLGESCH